MNYRVIRTRNGRTVATYGPFATRGLADHVALRSAEKHRDCVVSVEPIAPVAPASWEPAVTARTASGGQPCCSGCARALPLGGAHLERGSYVACSSRCSLVVDARIAVRATRETLGEEELRLRLSTSVAVNDAFRKVAR